MSFRPALPHGELRKIFDDVYTVTGTISMKAPVRMNFSRNMTVIASGGSLTLVGSVRLDEAGLAALDELGKVEHVIRLAAFHGVDDPFYKDRYGAKVWALEGSSYARGFDAARPASEGYFQPDAWLTKTSELPLSGAKLFVFESAKPREGLLLLERDGGIVISGDALQNWHRADAYFNFPARVVMKLMGFLKPCNVGPGWWRGAKPDPAELRRVLDLEFDHVLPCHGEEVIGGAREKYRPAIDRLAPAGD